MKKIKSILLSALLIVASLSGLTTVCQALDTEDDTLYPGDKVTVTYSFAKDIPEGCGYYCFKTNYPLEIVKYSGFKNHWVLKPRIDKATIYYYKIVRVQGMTPDNSHYGPQVKAGQKIISVIYDVIKEAKVSDLNFSLIKLELGINNQYGYLRDLSYLSYDVKITSKGEKPTEPTTVGPTTVEPTTVEPTTVEPTTVEPTTVEPTTIEPTTAELTTIEPTTAEPTTVEPTEAPTTVPTTTQPTTTEPTEEPIATNPATVPTVSQPSTSADSTTATDSSTVASVTSDVTNTETTISANPSASGKSDSTNDEVNSNTNNSQNGNQNDNGVVKTGVPSMSMIVLVIMISSLAVIYFVRKRVK